MCWLTGQSAMFSAARLLSSNTKTQCFRAEGTPYFIQQDSVVQRCPL